MSSLLIPPSGGRKVTALGSTYRRLAPVEPKNPVVPEAAPGALRLPIVGVS